jgi:hypothetical protein
MPFTVTWDPAAENKLASLWNDASDRQAIADSADLIDRQLRNTPGQCGQDLGTFRVYTVPPLTVVFKVFPDDMKAKVLDVWLSASSTAGSE